MEQARLIIDGASAVSLWIAVTRSDRRRGLLRREGIDGALLLPKVRSVHTIGMRFAIDVGFGRWRQGDGSTNAGRAEVVEVIAMAPGRVCRPRRCDFVLEAERGTMARWGIEPGTHIRIDAGEGASPV